MERIRRLLQHPVYRECLEANFKAEEKREYCHHDLEHFLAVARIMYIRVLESRLNYSKELIYATALLHDIGRFREYEDHTAHDRAGAVLAGKILPECGFSREECEIITDAILQHRNEPACSGELSKLLYEADKSSRNCSFCRMKKSCKWSDEKKRMHWEHLG